jgi:hypothetical protein
MSSSPETASAVGKGAAVDAGGANVGGRAVGTGGAAEARTTGVPTLGATVGGLGGAIHPTETRKANKIVAVRFTWAILKQRAKA